MKILQDALATLQEEADSHEKKHSKLLKAIESAQAEKAEAQARLDKLIAERDAEYTPEHIRLSTEISAVARANGGRSLFDGKGVAEARARGEDIGVGAGQPQ